MWYVLNFQIIILNFLHHDKLNLVNYINQSVTSPIAARLIYVFLQRTYY